MKRTVMSLTLAVVLLAVGVPAVAETGPDRARELVGKALVLELAEKLGLYSDEVPLLLEEWKAYEQSRADLKAKRAGARAALRAAIDDGESEREILRLLDGLVDAEEALFKLKIRTCEAHMGMLTGAQLAEVYLFLKDYDERVEAALQAMCPATDDVAALPVPETEPEPAALSPEEAALAAARAWGEALAAEDLDRIMALFSEDFEHYEYGDKHGISDFLGMAIEMGYLMDVEVLLDDAEVEVDGDEVVIYPIDLMGAFGSVSFELIFKEVDGEMKIVSLDAAGI